MRKRLRREVRKSIQGPVLSRGNIIGGSFSTEEMLFNNYAEEKELQFADSISDTGKRKEFELKVMDVEDIWRDRIKELRDILANLKKEEKMLKKESSDKKALKHHKIYIRKIPDNLLSCVESLERLRKRSYTSRERLLYDITQALQEVTKDKNVVFEYLRALKKECPHIF